MKLPCSIDATWKYDRATIETTQDYDAMKNHIKRLMIDGFAGPADTGKFSASLQETVSIVPIFLSIHECY